MLTLKAHQYAITSVAFSPDSRRIVSCSEDGTLKVWDARQAHDLTILRGHTSWINRVSFSPDGELLVTASADRTVRVWKVATGQAVRVLKGPPSGHVAFSADGKQIICRNPPQPEMRWDVASGQPTTEAARLPLFESRRSRDGRLLAVVDNLVVRVHRLPDGKEREPGWRWWIDPDHRWHASQAQESLEAGRWFGARFHLDRLLHERPWEAERHMARAYARARLEQPTGAALNYLQAMLLDPRVRLWPADHAAAGRGEKAAEAGDWRRALAELELAAHQPEAVFATWADLMLLRSIARAKGPRSCREMLDRFESDASLAWPLVYCCLAAPCEEADTARLVKLAERLVAQERLAATLGLHGAVLYRAGRYEESAKTLQESNQLHRRGGAVASWLFLGMAQKQLGHPAEARESLSRVESGLNEQKGSVWQEREYQRLLLEEARRLILTMPRDME
jgi:hypothetical protein